MKRWGWTDWMIMALLILAAVVAWDQEYARASFHVSTATFILLATRMPTWKD